MTKRVAAVSLSILMTLFAPGLGPYELLAQQQAAGVQASQTLGSVPALAVPVGLGPSGTGISPTALRLGGASALPSASNTRVTPLAGAQALPTSAIEVRQAPQAPLPPHAAIVPAPTVSPLKTPAKAAPGVGADEKPQTPPERLAMQNLLEHAPRAAALAAAEGLGHARTSMESNFLQAAGLGSSPAAAVSAPTRAPRPLLQARLRPALAPAGKQAALKPSPFVAHTPATVANLERMLKNRLLGHSTLLVGEAGTGKNALIYELARLRGRKVKVLSLNENTEARDLIVRTVIKDGRTVL
ncbi:MAG: AAA family ATPase, partial [Elusimicrobiota bacterium]